MPWYRDNHKAVHVATYKSDWMMSLAIDAATRHGWTVQSVSATEGHVNVGRTAGRVFLSIPAILLLGASRSKGKKVVTFVRPTPPSMPVTRPRADRPIDGGTIPPSSDWHVSHLGQRIAGMGAPPTMETNCGHRKYGTTLSSHGRLVVSTENVTYKIDGVSLFKKPLVIPLSTILEVREGKALARVAKTMIVVTAEESHEFIPELFDRKMTEIMPVLKSFLADLAEA